MLGGVLGEERYAEEEGRGQEAEGAGGAVVPFGATGGGGEEVPGRLQDGGGRGPPVHGDRVADQREARCARHLRSLPWVSWTAGRVRAGSPPEGAERQVSSVATSWLIFS